MKSINEIGDWSNFTVVSEYLQKNTLKCLKNTFKTDFEALKHVCSCIFKVFSVYFRIIGRYWPQKCCLDHFSVTKANLAISKGMPVFILLITLQMFVELYQNFKFLLEMSFFHVRQMENVASTLAFLMVSQFVYSLSILPMQNKSSFPKPPKNGNSSYPLF